MSSTPSNGTVGGVVTPVAEEQKEFLAEVEVMDLSGIKDKTFMVAVNTGDLNKPRFICSTAHGPYNFTEMCQEVGDMWVQHQHHAKVVILEKDFAKKVLLLDANTVDYIECHYNDIILEEMVASFDQKEYTCAAGTIEDPESNPLNGKTPQTA